MNKNENKQMKYMLENLSTINLSLETKNNRVSFVDKSNKIKNTYDYVNQELIKSDIEKMSTQTLYEISKRITDTLQSTIPTNNQLTLVKFLLDINNRSTQIISFRLSKLLYESFFTIELSNTLIKDNAESIDYNKVSSYKEQLEFYASNIKLPVDTCLYVERTILNLNQILNQKELIKRRK